MPEKVVTPQQIKEFDELMIKKFKIPGIILMENAARSFSDELIKELPQCSRVLIICGTGNNGGDGLAVCRQLLMRGVDAKVIILGEESKLSRDAKVNFEILSAANAGAVLVQNVTEFEAAAAGLSFDAVVDAVFGTGLIRNIEGLILRAVRFINGCSKPVFAVDIPTGIDLNTGHVLGEAVKADMTVTFQYAKRGQLLFPGREYCGKLKIVPIAWPVESQDYGERLTSQDLVNMLPVRKSGSNKGDFGRALLVAGSAGFSGAAVMAAASALRTGCGLIKVATVEPVDKAFSNLPEAMVHVVSDNWSQDVLQRLLELAQGAAALAIGPGLGKSAHLAQIVESMVELNLPTVIDADGLNAIAGMHKEKLFSINPNVILTPHPGEMARLSGKSIGDILLNPVSCAKEAASGWNCTIALKGATSIIASPKGQITFNTTGNPGLSKGGSGDVLTGIILSLLCQGLKTYDAARLGAYILGSAADEAVQTISQRSLLASDVIGTLRKVLP